MANAPAGRPHGTDDAAPGHDPVAAAPLFGDAPQDGELLLRGLRQAADGMVVVDDQGRVLLYNPAAEALCGVPCEQVLGQPLDVLLPPGSGDSLVARLKSRRGKPRSSGPCLLAHSVDGVSRMLSVTLSSVRQGRRRLHIALLRDASSQPQHEKQARQLSQALDCSENAIVICDRHTRIQYASAAFTRLFGYPAEAALNRRPRDLLSGPYTDVATLRQLEEHRRAGQPYQTDVLVYRSDGTPLWIYTACTPVPDANGEFNSFVIVFSDVTQAKTNRILHDKVLDALVREQPLRESMALICQEVERVAPDLLASVICIDQEQRMRPLAAPSVPPAFSELINGMTIGPNVGACGTAAWRGRSVVVADIANDPLFAGFRDQALSQGLRACWSNPIKSSTNQVLGTLAFYYREPRLPAPWHAQLAELCVHLCALALEREQTKARVHQLAFYDSLTGLPNRMMFNARAEQALATAEHNGEPVAVLFVDLDRFKRINETQGHAAGDGLLRDIARRLGETAGSGALVGRQAGDEFVLLLPQCGAEQAAGVSERLLGALAESLVVGHMTVHTSASIGVAMFPDDGLDIDTLLRHADLAMFRAKDEGGGSFRFFSPDMNRLAQERIAMETALREALRRDQLHLHYQPQLCSRTQQLYGVEALLRWEHPQLGPISPARFVPMAEECGLVEEMGNWVLRQACRQMADWRRRGVAVPRVSVNLSASSFDSATLPAQLQQLLADHRLQPQDLVLEITESVMLSPQARVLHNLDAIQKLGIDLSLDDFGTGYSSLSHLHRLPINELKLDMSFVRDIEHSETARTLITSVLRIGENLRKHVVAEGVETEIQRRFLADEGCEVLQGYLFSPALPARELEAWIGRD